MAKKNSNISKRSLSKDIKPGKNYELSVVTGVRASAGELEISSQLQENLPNDTRTVLNIVQRLELKILLLRILSKITSPFTLKINSKLTIEPNHIYAAPSNKGLEIKDKNLLVSRRNVLNRLFSS